MNQPLFCADGSRAVAENPIGNASIHQVYILVECPTPWEYGAFNSSPIPQRLRELPDELYYAGKSVRFLLIYNHELALPQQYRVLIYQRQEGWSQGYQKQEYRVETLQVVPSLVEAYFAGKATTQQPIPDKTRDLLVCTHGSHDQCCARYGKPFFYEAKKLIKRLGLERVRVWETSHFGGHRFAPTVIDLPCGRYYGKLNPSGLEAVLQQAGNDQVFRQMYRGWGILPDAAQVLEQALILHWGWAWFQNYVFLPVIETKASEIEYWVKLLYQQPDGTVSAYEGCMIQDPEQTLCIRGSCSTSKVSNFVQWQVGEVNSLKITNEDVAGITSQ